MNLCTAIFAVIQLFFVFNLKYPTETDSIMEVMQRIIVDFGQMDSAKNRKKQVKFAFRNLLEFTAQFLVDMKKCDVKRVLQRTTSGFSLVKCMT